MCAKATLRSAAGAPRAVLQTLLRKKWIAREDLSDVRDASRTVQIATLNGKHCRASSTPTQQTIVDYPATHQARTRRRAPVDSAARSLAVPRTTLQTLVRRGVVELSEEPAALPHVGHEAAQAGVPLHPRAKGRAGRRSSPAADERKFLPMLLHGVTGSGKTAVYLSAMQAVLAKGRSAILLVPEIGLTPAMAADLHQIFGGEVAILHSGSQRR